MPTPERIPQFLIAAPYSNGGKTTITLGLLALLHQRGFRVQPYKCGPDYLDTQLHTRAAGRAGINLDLYMCTQPHVKSLYAQYTSDADVAIVEGVMGLFDGAKKREASSADVSILLDIPVILVVNAKSVAYSVAPLLYGFKHFDPQVTIAGVIFNFVNTASHYQFLKDACEDVGITPLGYVPVNDSIALKSRHLGLQTDDSQPWEAHFEKIAAHIEQHLEVDRLLEITTRPQPQTQRHASVPKGKLKIAVAKDAAFHFTYFENLQALHRLGEVTFFSPLSDHELPEADLVYLSGGYPELHLEHLSANTAMHKSIAIHIDNGRHLLAECGGLMYLGKAITDTNGQQHAMAGIFPFTTTMENARLKLGYREFSHAGTTCRGHEFHYSAIANDEEVAHVGQFMSARQKAMPLKLYRHKNAFATYFHAYWGENNAFLKEVVMGNKPL